MGTRNALFSGIEKSALKVLKLYKIMINTVKMFVMISVSKCKVL